MLAPISTYYVVLQLRMTHTHYMYIATAPGQPFTSRTAPPAAQIRAGQYVWVAGASTASAAVSALSRVTSVRRVMDVGLVNPFTLRGKHSAEHAGPLRPH